MRNHRHIYLLPFLLLSCLYNNVSLAQGVCNSTALAPVYKQDFSFASKSSSKSQVPPGFITNYNFGTDNNGSLNDGYYIVTPRIENGGHADWTTGGDHTGNTNGNMLLINAGRPSAGPVDLIFSQQVNNLCPGSVYSFSAWLVNVNTNSKTVPICGPFGSSGTIPAKVTFNIKNTSGTVLQTYTTPDLPLTATPAGPPNWQQYGFQFTLPAGTTSLVLEMRDAWGGQLNYCGNDLAVDDILFSACTPTVTTSINSATSASVCPGSSITVNSALTNSPFSSPAYQWQKSTNGGTTWANVGTPGTSANNFTLTNVAATDAGMYRVLVGPDVSSLSSSTCVTASNSITLNVYPSPAVSVTGSSPVCSGNSVVLSSTASGGTPGYTYSWTGPNSFASTISNPSIPNSTTAASGTYSLTVTDTKSCTATASTAVTVNQTPVVAAISGPNGGCAGSTIQLSSSTSGGTWTSSNTSVATIDNTGLVTIVAGGTSTITYTVTNNGCSASVTKNIGAASVFMSPDYLECNNGVRTYDSTAANPYRVKYDNPVTGTYNWKITDGNGTDVTSSVFKNSSTGPYPSVQLLRGNWYTVQVIYTSNGITCTASHKVYKEINVADTIAGSRDTTVCYTTNSIPISVKTSAVVTTLNWGTTGSGSFSPNNSINTTYTPSAADKAKGVITLYVTASTSINATGSCGSATATDSMKLRIYPNNTGKDSAKTVCSNQTVNYTPVSAVAGSTFSWASAVTSGSISGNSPSGTGNITDSLINLSNTSNGVVNYTITPYAFTPSNVSCPGSPFNFTVTLQPRPAVNITNNTASLCTGTTTNIQFNSSIAGSLYTWSSSVISGAATGNSSNAVPSATNTINDVLTNSSTTANATVRYRITAIPPTGCSRTDSTDVLVYALPTKAVAGSAQSLCSATSTMLTGNTPIIGTGTWTLASGPSGSSFSNPNAPSTAVNGLTAGTYKFVWSIVNGSCAASTDTVTVTNSATTVAGTLASPATVCAGSNTGTLTLSGYTGSILNWQSSTDGGTTWTNIANTTNTYTYNNLTTSTFFRAVVQSGACSTASSPSVAITVTPASSSGNLAANATVCAASNSGTLNLTGYTGTVTRWESSTDNGATWASIVNTTSSYSYANITATTLYRAVTQSGNCGIVNSNNVTITVNPQTVAGTLAASNTVCATANTGTLTLSGYTGTILNWQSSTDNGTTWTNIANTTANYTYNNLTATTLFKAQVQSGVCNTISSNAVTITVMQPVTAASAGPNQALCNVTSTTMAANAPTSGTGTWTQVSGPTTASFTNINNPFTTVNNLTTGTYQFQWNITNGPCASSQSTVQVTIDPQTVPGTLASPATVCATSNTGTLTLSGYTSAILNWQSSTNNGTTWTNIANTTANYTYNNLTATTLFRAQVQSGSCAAQYSNNVAITVAQAVTPANAGPNQSLCNVTSTTMAATAVSSGTGTWTQVSGPSTASFTDSHNPFTTVNGLTSGIYQFQWTVSNGVCASSQSTVQISIDPQTVPGSLASPATVCATSNTGTLTLSGYTSTILKWQSSADNGTTWIDIANTTNTYTYTNLTATTLFRASVKSGACAAQNSNNVAITVLQTVTPSVAGNDQQLCNVTSATMAANAPTSGTGTWTQVSGPTAASFTDTHNPNTTVNNLSFGTYQFKWTISNGYCASSQSTVNITVNTPSVPGTLAANATVCATANNGTLTLSGYSTNIVRWEFSTDNGNTWTNIANTGNTNTYNNLIATTQYRALVQNTVCPAAYSNAAIITVFQPVTTSNAGPAQTLCNVTSATLAANAPASGSGTWTKASGPTAVSFTNPNDPNTTVTGLATGIYQFVWTISNGVCASSQSTVQVEVDALTAPGTLASPATVCVTANAGTLTLSGYSTNILHWESSTDNGNTWTNIINTANTYTYNNIPATTLYRVLVKNGVCASQYSNNVAITALAAVSTANAGTDQQLCNVTSATMAATLPTSGTGTWTQVSGPSTATFTNLHDPNTTVNGLSFGTYQFKWTVSNGYCANSEATVNITINTPSVPGTLAANATVCATANNGTLTLSGYSTNIVRWESSADNGSTWSNIANTAATYTYTNLAATSLFRALVQNTVCPALYSNQVAVTVFQPVTASNAGPNQTLCNVTSATLAANAPTSGSGTWTKVTGPSAVTFTNPNDPNTTVSGLIAGTYTFQWTISNGVCASSQSTVQVQVDPATIPGTLASPATVCATANAGTLTLSGYTSAVLHWESSTDNGNTWGAIINTNSTYSYSNLTSTTLFRASVKSGSCAAQYSNNVAITVVPAVTTANAGTNQTLCNVTATTLAGNIPTSGTGTWTKVSGPTSVTFTNANDPNTMVSGLTTGTYQFQWTISNGVCTSSQSTVQVEVDPATVPGTLASPASVCATGNAGTLTLSGYTSSILKWQSSTDNGNTWLDIANTSNTYPYNNLTQSTLFRASVKSGVCAAQYSNNVAITVMQAVTTANAGPDQQLCNVTSATLAGNTPASGTGTWSFVSGPSAVTFTNPNNPTTTVYGLTTGTYQLRWTIANGPCAVSQSVMNITVFAPSVPGTLASDATVCATANGGTVALSGYSTNILRWESSTDNGNTWTNIANTANTFNYSNLTATTKYRALVQNGICPALYSNLVTVNVIQPVSTANAGPDQSITFIFATAQLNAVPPTSGTGQWSQLTGPTTVSFVNTADPKTSITGLTYVAGTPPSNGVYTFRWTVSNGICANSYADVTITVAPPTNPGVIGPDQVVCRGVNHGTLTLSQYNGTILRWEDSTSGSTWQPIASTVGANTPTYTFDNLIVTTYYRALVQASGGQPLYSGVSATITVVQPVTPSNAGPDQSLCSTSTTTLAGNIPTQGTGKWTQTSGSPTTIVNPLDPNTVINGLAVGTYQFAWTISNGICADSKTFVNITVHPLTVPGNLVTPATVCANLNNGNLSLSGYTGSILKWQSSTDNGTTWADIANTTAGYTYNNIPATTEYRVLVQNSPCPSLYSNIVTITALQAVTTAHAGATQELCNVSSATLAGNTPTSGTGTWSFVSGPSTVTFNDIHNPTTDVYGLVQGTYKLMWTISNALCTPSTDVVTINVHPPTVAGSLAAPATVCATSNNGILNLTGYTGTINKWQSSTNNGATWTDISNTTASYNYSNLTTNTQFRAEVQNSVCPSLVSNVVAITVIQPVTTANAGPNQQLCNVASTTLAGNNPTSGTGIWTQVSGPSTASFVNPNAYNTTVNGLVAGTYQFQWTISNNTCTSSQSTMNVTVYAATVAGSLAAPATVCATSNTGTLNLTGYTGTINKWQSSVDNGATWIDITNTTASYNYTNLTATTLFRAQVQNAVCPALPSNNVTITVLQPVTTANAGPDQQLCNTTSTSLAGNVPASGTGTWSQVSGPTTGSFVNNTDPHTVVNGLTVGTYTFQWTISNSTCANSQSTIKITVYPATVAGSLVAPATVCATANTGTLNLTGNTGNINKWQSSIDNGTTWTNITNTAASYTYNNLTTSTQFRAEVQNTVCPALVSNVVTITVIQPVTTANAGPDQQLCNVASATLAGNNPTSGTGTWTQVSGPSTASFANPNAYNTTVSGLATGTYQFQWTISNNTCASSQSTMKVTVYAATVAGSLAAPATVCATANNGTLNLTGYTGTINKWEYSINNGSTWTDIVNTTASYTYNNLTANTQFRAEVQNAVCPALVSTAVTITVLQPVTTANAGPDQQLCNVSSAKLSANTPTSGTGTWSMVSGPAAVSFTNPNDPATTVNGLQTGTYQLAWTITNAACTQSTATMKITVYAATVAGSLAAPATVCSTSNNGTLNLTGNTGAINKWQSSIDNGTTWADIANTAANYTYNNLNTTTQFRAQVQNGACLVLASSPVTITVLQPVTTANAGPDQQLCNVASTTLAGNNPTSGTGTWTMVSGPSTASFTNPNAYNTTANGLVAGTYQFQWTISNNTCASSQSTMKVTVYAATVAGTLAAPATVCATANNGTLNLTGYTGAINKWQSSIDNGTTWADIANTAAANYSYNNLNTTMQFRVQVQNVVCPALVSSAVTITVLQPVTTANAGPDQQLCNVSSAKLSANTPTSGTGTWSMVSGPAAVSFTNPNDPATTVNGLQTGTYQLAWTITNAACAQSTATMKITVYAATNAGSLAAPATVCATANTGNLNLTGYTGNINKWQSSTDNGTTWTDIAFTGAGYTYNNLTATTLFRAQVQNGVCITQASSPVTITVLQPVTTAHAGPAQNLCNVSVTQLAANAPSSGTGTWSLISGPSIVVFSNVNNAATTVSGLQPGTYKFAWNISNGSCADSKDSVAVTVFALSNGGKLAPDAFACVTGNAGTLQVTGYTGNIVRWEISTDSGTTWNSTSNVAATYNYNNLLTTTQFRVLVQNGPCSIAYSNIATINVRPASVGGKLNSASSAVCATANIDSLRLTGYTGVVQHWEYSTDKGASWTSFINSEDKYTYTNLTTTTWFRVLVQSSVCSSAYSDTFVVRVDSATVAGKLASDAVVCYNANNGSIKLSGRTGSVLRWEFSTDSTHSWNALNNNTSDVQQYNNLLTTTWYRTWVQNGTCASMATNVVTITTMQPVTIAHAGPNQLVCDGSSRVTLAANLPTSGVGKWSMASGPSTPSFLNVLSPSTDVSGLQKGVYKFVWTIANDVCNSSSDTVTITIDKLQTGFRLSAINDCGKTTFFFTDTTSTSFGIQSWKWYTPGVGGDTVRTRNNSIVYTADGMQSIALTVQSNSGCVNTRQANYKVTVFNFPQANINALTEICKTQFMRVSPDVHSKDSIAYFLWNLGNGKKSLDSVVTVQYVEDGNYTVKLTVATINRCFDSAYKAITVHPIPAVTITSNTNVCKGDTATLKADGAASYIWSDQNNNILCSNCQVLKVQPGSSSQYKVVGVSQYGCSEIQTTNLHLVQPLKMLAAQGDTICYGQSKRLFAAGANSYTWYPETGLSNKNAATPVASPQQTTTYHVIGKDQYGCFADTAEVKMVVGLPTAIHIGKDTVMSAGDILQIKTVTERPDIVKWAWYGSSNLSCYNCATPQLKVGDDVSLICRATNRYGCISIDTLNIKTFCPGTLVFIPNAFSPDGDGINDVLMIQGKGVKVIKSFRIFNRWGEVVFEKMNFQPGDPAYAWDGKVRGKPATPDVFVYICEVICDKGVPSFFKGNITILK
ncbi:gliding motility-associated C-terminal domain-containing protein [Asinibacterium sp. OR53]|uniref:PKD domain-containing protein n=1 Tax=Asinibacterium sp. OR53 TaxID=925409 RepID=UPI0004BA9E54|nr:gliding motility-associated C-terminal domain-containing protein [Asinibacterium sp. OR53]